MVTQIVRIVRNFLKTCVYILSFFSSLCFSFFVPKKENIIVLMYHSFDKSGWRFGVSSSALKWQILYLLKNKKIISFSEIISFLNGDTDLPNDAVVITVDDGYEDTYNVLFPLAKKYNFPFTIFLTSDLLTQKKFGNLNRPTWKQLKEMQESGLVSVEVHGKTHVNWTDIENDEKKLKEEVLGCRNDIEKHIGHKSIFCAYPAGRCSDKIVTFLKENNFKGATVITEGAVLKGDNVFLIKRVQVDRSMNKLLFCMRLDYFTLKIISFLRKKILYVRR